MLQTTYSYQSEVILPVFTYGSLRVGFHNSRLIDLFPHTRRKGSVSGFEMYAARGGYPFSVYGSGNLTGELVTFSPEVFPSALFHLDNLEGYNPSNPDADPFYTRIRTDVTLADGRVQEAWMYVAHSALQDHIRTHLVQVTSGDWASYTPPSDASASRRALLY